jgi:PKD repeat protein
MRKLLPILPFLAPLLGALVPGCGAEPTLGPGIVTITETTTSTSTSTTTTSTIPEPTTARFTFSPITPEALQFVRFNASSSTPGTGRTIVRYEWDFGDGTEKTGVTSEHDFYPSGVYLVTLTVVDNTGQRAMSSQTITVRPAPPVVP